MKANNKRKVFGDTVDLLMDEIEERDVPRGIQIIQIKNIQPFLFFASTNYLKMQRHFPKVAAGNSSKLHKLPGAC